MNDTESRTTSRSDWSQLSAGLIIAGLGVILLLAKSEIVPIQHLFNYWPLLVVAVGVARLVGGGREDRRHGLTFVFIGCWLLISSLGLFGLSWGTSWPLTMVAVGLSNLVGGSGVTERSHGVLMIAIGGLLQAALMGWIPLGLGEIWPLILVLVGLSIIVGAFWGRPRSRRRRNEQN